MFLIGVVIRATVVRGTCATQTQQTRQGEYSSRFYIPIVYHRRLYIKIEADRQKISSFSRSGTDFTVNNQIT
jgi:hypothetical protein